MRWLVVLGCVVMLEPSIADACSCAAPRVVVSPRASVVAPLNTIIRVTWSDSPYRPRATASAPDDQTGADPARWPSTIALVTQEGVAIAVDRRSWTSGAVHTVMLTPRKPLAPSSRYRVLTGPAARATVLGEIVTGTTSDDQPPTWTGGVRAQYIETPRDDGMCMAGDPFVSIAIAKPAALQDDQTPPSDIAFVVLPAAGPLRAEAMIAIVPGRRDHVILGRSSICMQSNFDVPSNKPIALRIAPVDLAGNAGTPATIRIAPATATP